MMEGSGSGPLTYRTDPVPEIQKHRILQIRIRNTAGYPAYLCVFGEPNLNAGLVSNIKKTWFAVSVYLGWTVPAAERDSHAGAHRSGADQWEARATAQQPITISRRVRYLQQSNEGATRSFLCRVLGEKPSLIIKYFDMGYQSVLDSMKIRNFRRTFSLPQFLFFWPIPVPVFVFPSQSR